MQVSGRHGLLSGLDKAWVAAWLCLSLALAWGQVAEHGMKYNRLLITNAMVVEGSGIPASGPWDIVLEGNRIIDIQRAKELGAHRGNAAARIDAKGKYVLPGFINMHGHLQDSRARIKMPFQYQYNLWLACGITTIRDVGSDKAKAVIERKNSEADLYPAPRIYLYMWFPGGLTQKEIAESIRELKQLGADGVKFHQLDRATFQMAAREATLQGLKIAHHVGVKDANAWDDIAEKTTTIEHWYGVPDAALTQVQSFPPEFNHSDELHRFRYAGRLWREANPDKLRDVLQAMAEANVAWDPTFSIYEACRDLQRAVSQPWFDEYLHPALEKFFTPNPTYHGSFFWGWTTTDEVYWRENYQIWMKAVRDFAAMGGIVTTGEDAGFIYRMHGFGFLRELELHEEAGFRPLEVITHATHNSAVVLGQGEQLGRIKRGFLADLVIVNGNPLENLRILFPPVKTRFLNAAREVGGVEWTIKNGIPYHAPTLLAEVREMVVKARQDHASTGKTEAK